jgi:hypothetical protein
MIDFKPDALDDLIGGVSIAKAHDPVQPPAHYEYTETCPKCRGTGRFVGYSGRSLGQCFACKGAGRHSFKTSPEHRAAQATQRVARKDRQETDALETFKAEHPAIHAWIEERHLRFGFAADMRAAILRFGSLTEGKLAACQRMVDQDAAKAADRAERIQAAPEADTAGVDRLKAAFDKAIAASRAKGRGLKMPRITIGNVVISPAKETSKNPGALYAYDGGEYIGKIAGGRFFAARECRPEQEKRVLAFIADPKAAAEAYGIETGVCCICNATLTNKISIERGIGPICAENFGW